MENDFLIARTVNNTRRSRLDHWRPLGFVVCPTLHLDHYPSLTINRRSYWLSVFETENPSAIPWLFEKVTLRFACRVIATPVILFLLAIVSSYSKWHQLKCEVGHQSYSHAAMTYSDHQLWVQVALPKSIVATLTPKQIVLVIFFKFCESKIRSSRNRTQYGMLKFFLFWMLAMEIGWWIHIYPVIFHIDCA